MCSYLCLVSANIYFLRRMVCVTVPSHDTVLPLTHKLLKGGLDSGGDCQVHEI